MTNHDYSPKPPQGGSGISNRGLEVNDARIASQQATSILVALISIHKYSYFKAIEVWDYLFDQIYTGIHTED